MSQIKNPIFAALESLPPRSLPYGVLFISALGQQHGAPQHPFLIFGHDALDTAAFFAEASTLTTLAVRSLPNLEKAIAHHTCSGLFAMSRPEYPGEAAEALRLFSEKSAAPGLKLYGAWTYDVEAAIEKALLADAHGVILPDCDAQEMFTYIFSCLQAIAENRSLPSDRQTMLEHLRAAFPRSPFWQHSQSEPSSLY